MGEGVRHIDAYKNNPEYAHNFRGMDRSPKVNWRKDARRDPLPGDGCHAVDLLRWAVNDRIEESFAYGTKRSAGSVRAFRTEMTIS